MDRVPEGSVFLSFHACHCQPLETSCCEVVVEIENLHAFLCPMLVMSIVSVSCGATKAL